MGIQGLLPLLKSIEKPVHLKDYAGQTLAVDGYVWLHRGAFACAQELCLGQTTHKYVTYFMRRIEMFKFFGVKPYVVFDGGYLPSKAVTEKDRLARREESKKQAMELLRAGKSKQALEQFRKCVDVTPEMAFAVIQALEAARVDFIVAPYEADAQMAYLEKSGLVDGIVTEDSDLLVFGCKKVIFKMDQYGAGVEILSKNFSLVQDISFHNWTMTEIRHMCILAGCDYLPSISGMGIKTAQRLLRRFKTFDRTIKHIRMENTSAKIQSDYEGAFRKAELTFLYARVYDPITKSMVHLSPVPEELQELFQTEEYDFLGPVLEETIIQDIAMGKINPISKAKLSYPLNQWPMQKPTQILTGKENKLSHCIDKYLRPSMPSTKSIHAYFGKAPMPTATSPSISSSILSKADILVTEKAQKREPLPAPGVISKRRTLEKTPLSESTSLSTESNITSGVLSMHKQKATAKINQSTVVVEARSRFFGLEASLESSEGGYATKKTRSPVIREDSGTGLDEACLLQLPSIYGSQQDAHSSSSQESSKSDSPSLVLSTPSSQEISETKKAETKVIQGWREKFSNPLGPTLTAATGLTRTFQPGTVKVKSMRSSAKSHSSKHPRAVSSMQQERVKSSCQDTSTVLNKTPKHLPLHSINNNNIHYQTNTMHRPSDSYPRTLITKSPKASLPHMSDVVMLRLGGANALPQTIEAENENESGNVRSTMLNLDRFKYTPVITPAVPESP